jgi:membrane-bound serine protease (ClpP class)
MSLVIRTHRSRITTGREGLLGEVGQVRTDLNPRGKVFVHGELWDAIVGELEPGIRRDSSRIDCGAEVEVVAVDGLTLRVRPINAERG